MFVQTPAALYYIIMLFRFVFKYKAQPSLQTQSRVGVEGRQIYISNFSPRSCSPYRTYTFIYRCTVLFLHFVQVVHRFCNIMPPYGLCFLFVPVFVAGKYYWRGNTVQGTKTKTISTVTTDECFCFLRGFQSYVFRRGTHTAAI